ncbi:hypothetical protein ACFPU1_11975 [Thalassorhabdus alkalitolerans]|uniref:Uncharacterized protein n=1 Tax=Thalassorhabdus alkalitolerans TaxID=2282697 RepID=A0ABW0YT12_9BACI|nr:MULTISPECIES: hypothetical protein [Bacillaceae]
MRTTMWTSMLALGVTSAAYAMTKGRRRKNMWQRMMEPMMNFDVEEWMPARSSAMQRIRRRVNKAI